MAALSLKANVALNSSSKDNEEAKVQIHSSWSLADDRNVSLRTKWDNPLLHDEVRTFQ